MADERGHALIVRWKLSDDLVGSHEERQTTYDIEDELVDALKDHEDANVDGHEFGGGFATIFIYGVNAKALATQVLQILDRREALPGSYVVMRYGPPGADESRRTLS